jgi:O-antigen ligase
MNLYNKPLPIKADLVLGIYVLGSAALFAASYILDLDSGPMYFGMAGLILALICAMAKGPRLPSKGTIFLLILLFVAVLNTLFALSKEQTAARWAMVLGLYACSLRLTELPPAVFRRTMELTLPWGLLLQVFALQRHLATNLGEEKTRLIWHTISLFAGLLIAAGLAHSRTALKYLLVAIGTGLVLLTGARGALLGIVGMGIALVFCQPSGRRMPYVLGFFILGCGALIFSSDFLNYYSGLKVVRATDDPIEHMMKSLEVRMDLVYAAWEYAKDVPWSGAGLGPAYFPSFKSITGLGHPHNSYVGMFIELGLLLGPLYTMMAAFVLWKAAKLRATSNLAILLAPSLAYFLMRGMAENYTLLALGNFATSTMVLMASAAINNESD